MGTHWISSYERKKMSKDVIRDSALALSQFITDICLIADANLTDRNELLTLVGVELINLISSSDFSNYNAIDGIVKLNK